MGYLVITTRRPCTMVGFPAITLVDAGGEPVLAHVIREPGPAVPVLLSPIAPAPDGGAQPGNGLVRLILRQWCIEPVDSGRLKVDLPGAAGHFELVTEIPMPRCDLPAGSPPTMTVGPVEAVGD